MTAPSLFEPIKLGELELNNRIFMAPMTRARAPRTVPTDSMATYYTQRAGAGLIISEAVAVSPQAMGSVALPGIYTEEQIAGWKRVTDSVHQAGGKIICQLWHAGRVSHRSIQENNQAPVSASEVEGNLMSFTEEGFVPASKPRALALEELPGIVDQHVQAAQAALSAGFDGVQVHSATGYLLEQFMRDGTNKRSDRYGGSIENRCRLTLEVVDAVADTMGAGRTAARISPMVSTWDCVDSNPVALFSYLMEELSKRNLAFVELVERMMKSFSNENAESETLERGIAAIRPHYRGNLVANGAYEFEDAKQAIGTGYAHAISFARDYISNPDLAQRLEKGWPLNPQAEQPDFYGNPEDYDAGYLNFPTMQDEAQSA